MTLSIIARCTRNGQFGVAAATAVPAVGKLLSYAAPGVGAVATQGRLNPYLGIDGIRLLELGRTAPEAVDELIARDNLSARRQLAMIDADGRTAVWTGHDCKDWAGVIEGDGFSVQGNRLAGPDVVEAAARHFAESADKPLIDRLVAGLAAGVAAGGDRLGQRSATALVMAEEDYPLWDIRVDDHDNPIGELKRLQEVFARDLLPHIERMPKRGSPSVDPDAFDG